MVRNSTNACATAKQFAPMCSPRCKDYQKNSGLPIWTTSWPYFLTVLSTWIASNKRNLKMKWCVTQQMLVLRQNSLHQCVYNVMKIIRKIVACQFEQLCDNVAKQKLVDVCISKQEKRTILLTLNCLLTVETLHLSGGQCHRTKCPWISSIRTGVEEGSRRLPNMACSWWKLSVKDTRWHPRKNN